MSKGRSLEVYMLWFTNKHLNFLRCTKTFLNLPIHVILDDVDSCSFKKKCSLCWETTIRTCVTTVSRSIPRKNTRYHFTQKVKNLKMCKSAFQLLHNQPHPTSSVLMIAFV